MGLAGSTDAEAGEPMDVADEEFLMEPNLGRFFRRYEAEVLGRAPDVVPSRPEVFSVVMDYLMMSQRECGKLVIPGDFEERVFGLIGSELGKFVEYAAPYGARFRFIESFMRKKLELEVYESRIERERMLRVWAYDGGGRKRRGNVEALMASVVEVVRENDGCDVCVIPRVSELCDAILGETCGLDFVGCDSEVLSSFCSVAGDLAALDTGMRVKMVNVLMHVSVCYGGVPAVLQALDIAIQAPGDVFTGEYLPDIVKFLGLSRNMPLHQSCLFGAKTVVSGVYSELYACAAFDDVVWLVVDSGLVLANLKSGKIEKCFEIENPPNKLVACDAASAYMYDKDTSVVTELNPTTGALVDRKLDTIEPGANVVGIACIVDCPFLLLVIETGFYEYEIAGCPLQQSHTGSFIPGIVKLSFAPKAVVPSRKSLILYGPSRDVAMMVLIDVNDDGDYCVTSSQYVPSCVIYHEEGLITSYMGMSYVVVLESSDMGSSLSIYHYPETYGVVLPVPECVYEIPDRHICTFADLLITTTRDISLLLDMVEADIAPNSEGPTQKAVKFFAASPEEIFACALRLGSKLLTNDTPKELHQMMLFFLLKLLKTCGRSLVAAYLSIDTARDFNKSELRSQLEKFFQQVVFHQAATEEIVAAVFAAVSVLFDAVCFPKDSFGTDFLVRFQYQPKLLAMAWPFLSSSLAILYSFDSHLLDILKCYLSNRVIHNIIQDSFKLLQEEMQSSSGSNSSQTLGSFVTGVLSFYTHLVSFNELFSRQQFSINILLRIATRLLLVKPTNPSSELLESCCNLLKLVWSNFSPSSTHKSVDRECMKLPQGPRREKVMKLNVETRHPYQNGKEITWAIQMYGARQIEVEFDPRCSTASVTDCLKIFDRDHGGTEVRKCLWGSCGQGDWPKKLVIPSDTCRFVFTTDEIGSDWGIKCSVSALVPLPHQVIKVDAVVTLFNVITYVMGRAVENIFTTQVSEISRVNDQLRESGLLYHLLELSESQIIGIYAQTRRILLQNDHDPESKDSNCEDARGKAQECSDVQALLDGLTADELAPSSPASLFLESLDECIRPKLIQRTYLSAIVERFACASMISALNLASTAWSFAVKLLELNGHPGNIEEPSVPPALRNVAKAMYTIRTALHRAHQQDGVADRPENTELMQRALEVIVKAKVLMSMSDVLGVQDNIEAAISFLCSDVSCLRLRKLGQQFHDTYKAHVHAIASVVDVLQDKNLFHTAKATILYFVQTSLAHITGTRHAHFMCDELRTMYGYELDRLQSVLLTMLVDKEASCGLRMLALKGLLLASYRLNGSTEIACSLLSFLTSRGASDEGEMTFLSNLWLFTANYILRHRSTEILSLSADIILQNPQNMSLCDRLCRVLGAMFCDGSLPCTQITLKIIPALRLDEPQNHVTAYQLLGVLWSTHGVSDDHLLLNLGDSVETFEQFVHQHVKLVGAATCTGTLPHLKATIASSHSLVIAEIITLFRTLLAPDSKLRERVQAILYDIMTQIASTNNLLGLMTHHLLLQYFLGIMAIVSNGVQTVYEGGYLFNTNGASSSEIMRVCSFSSLSKQVHGYSITNFLEVSSSVNSCIPVLRVPFDIENLQVPDSLTLFFVQLHTDLQDFLSANEDCEASPWVFALMRSFYIFVPTILQNPSILKQFVACFDLGNWLRISSLHTHEVRLHTLTELLLEMWDVHNSEARNEVKEVYSTSLETLQTACKPDLSNNRHDRSPEEVVKHLPYSVLPQNSRCFSPTHMVRWKVDVWNEPRSCVFVANASVSGAKKFYWEVTVNETSDSSMFKVGFLTMESPNHIPGMYGITWPNGELISPFTPPTPLGRDCERKDGDVLGIALVCRQIVFFLNGVELHKRIPASHMGPFAPLVEFIGPNADFVCNFGERPFRTDFSKHSIFYEDSRVELCPQAMPKNDSFASDSCDDADYELTVKRLLTTPGNKYPVAREITHLPLLNNGSPFVMKQEPLHPGIEIGSPCILGNVCQAGNSPGTSLAAHPLGRQLQNVGSSGIVVGLDNENSSLVQVEIIDALSGVSKTTSVSRYSLSPVPMRRNLFTDFGHERVIDPLYLVEMVNEQKALCYPPDFIKNETIMICLSRAFSIRMARYTSLLVMEHLISASQDIVQLCDRSLLLSFLTTCIIELIPFSPCVVVHPEWQKRSTENGRASLWNASPATDHSRMLSALYKILLWVCQHEERLHIMASLFSQAVRILCSQADHPETLFWQAPPHLRLESTHPCTGISIDYHFGHPNAVGFVPVVTRKCGLQIPITVAGRSFTGNPNNLQYINAREFSVVGEIDGASAPGLALAFIPIESSCGDCEMSTPRGAVHLIISLLSFLFSSNLSTTNQTMFQQTSNLIFASLVKILKSDGVFSKIFGFEFIAPLLTRLDWSSSDFTKPTVALLRQFFETHNVAKTCSELNSFDEKVVILNTLFDFIVANSDNNEGVVLMRQMEESHDRVSIARLYDILNEKAHPRFATNLQRLSYHFRSLVALTHHWMFPVRFPAFLLFEPFVSDGCDWLQIQDVSDFESSNGMITKQFTFAEAKQLKISFDAEDSSFLRVVTENEEHQLPPGSHMTLTGNSVCLQLPEDHGIISVMIQAIQKSEIERKEFFITNFETFKYYCDFMQEMWNHKIDESLLEIIYKEMKVLPPSLHLTPAQIASHPHLQNVPLPLLSMRFQLIKQLNCFSNMILLCMSLGDGGLFSSAVLAAKSAILTSHKLQDIEKIVMAPDTNSQLLTLNFNRRRAAVYMSDRSNPEAYSLFDQFMDQVPVESLQFLKRPDIPWRVQLDDELATDAGGPARDVFSQICIEVIHPLLDLFIPTPNQRAGYGPNQDVLIPNSRSKCDQKFMYVGILMAIAYISRLPQPFAFHGFVWSYLVGQEVTIEDIYSMDSEFEHLMKTLDGDLDASEITKMNLKFEVRDSHGTIVELCDNGSSTCVTQDNVASYVQRCKEMRIGEMDRQLNKIKEGISQLLAIDVLKFLSPWELEVFVCGNNDIPISELKKQCIYDEDDPSSEILWQILEEFTPAERMLFIKFATGRMGLPPIGSHWQSRLKIIWVTPKGDHDAEMDLPTATTCASTIRIPRYRTKDGMAKKLRTAIVFGVDIDDP